MLLVNFYLLNITVCEKKSNLPVQKPKGCGICSILYISQLLLNILYKVHHGELYSYFYPPP